MWRKLGLIFAPQGKPSWMRSHAALPIADRLGPHSYALYFSPRDAEGRAHVARVELDAEHGFRVRAVAERPSVAPGSLGTFDDRGATLGCVVTHQGVKYLYYTGWTLGVTVPFYYAVGLALSEDEGRSYRKLALGPIMARNPVDPYLVASPFVRVENGIWRMWYVSGARWALEGGKPKHYYHIRYAESDDGIHWRREGIVCIDFKSPDEYAIARPCVLKDGDTYKMWYSYRGKSYRIGYAESDDGIHWQRMDEQAGIDVSPQGWDAEMIEYPFVFDHADRRYMLYNGNGYGKSGVGLAVWEEGG